MRPQNKFGAVKTTIGGLKFDSKKEAARYAELRLLEHGGEIRNLQRQVPIPLIGMLGPLKTATGRQMKLTVDFTYEDKRLGWAKVFEDAKGMVTRDFAVRAAVAAAMGIAVVLS